MEQKTATVMKLQNENYFDLDEFGWNELRSLHTVRGQYSEIMVITDAGNGVFRIVLPRELQLLFSSDEAERKSIFDAIEAGQSVASVIASRVENEARQVIDAAAAVAAERETQQASAFTLTPGLASSAPNAATRAPDNPAIETSDTASGEARVPHPAKLKPARSPRRWSLIAAAALIPVTVIVLVALVALYAPAVARQWSKDPTITSAATTPVLPSVAPPTPVAKPSPPVPDAPTPASASDTVTPESIAPVAPPPGAAAPSP